MIPITKPCIGEEEIRAVSEVLRSGWVSQGPKVVEFEAAFAGYVGAKHACAVSSCTTALHLALLGLGIENGDEVITVSHSFIATANAIRYCGAIPIFVDIESSTCNIDPTKIESSINPRTKAILCVHQMGMPCDMRAILAIASRHALMVIEDAACAIGSEIKADGKWEKIGKPHGDVACFSFHPRKVITAGEGGMLTTSDPELDQRFRLLRQHCMSVADTKRHSASEVTFESYLDIGFNYRMSDLQAAMGCVQLQRLPEIIVRRRYLAARYTTLLSAVNDIALPVEQEWGRSNIQSFWVRLSENVDQKVIMQLMLDDGVATRRGIMCSHLEPAYENHSGSDATKMHENLRQSELAQNHCIILPLFPQMDDADQNCVVSALISALEKCSSESRSRNITDVV